MYLAEKNFDKVIASSAFITIAGLKATKKQRKRKHWMSTVYQSRDKYRGLDLLIDLKRDTGQFINFCRMSPTDFKFLLGKISDKICKKSINFREAIPPKERLTLTFRFLATGDSYTNYWRDSITVPPFYILELNQV